MQVDGRSTPKAFRRRVVQTFLLGAVNLRASLSYSSNARVVCGVALPRIVDSELTVIFDDTFFERFFRRRWGAMIWEPLPHRRSLRREWQLELPEAFGEFGVRQVLDDGDRHISSEIWWYGDVAGVAELLGLCIGADEGDVAGPESGLWQAVAAPLGDRHPGGGRPVGDARQRGAAGKGGGGNENGHRVDGAHIHT